MSYYGHLPLLREKTTPYVSQAAICQHLQGKPLKRQLLTPSNVIFFRQQWEMSAITFIFEVREIGYRVFASLHSKTVEYLPLIIVTLWPRPLFPPVCIIVM